MSEAWEADDQPTDYSWEFSLERLHEIREDHRAAMLGRQEIQRLVDHYLADFRRGITCAHCSCDMSKQKVHERCSNGALCVSIEEFDQQKVRDMQQSLKLPNNDLEDKTVESLMDRDGE